MMVLKIILSATLWLIFTFVLVLLLKTSFRLKKIVRQAIAILNRKERKQLKLLTFLNIVISIADILLLVVMLGIVQIYLQPGIAVDKGWVGRWLSPATFFLPAAIFLIVFVAKNIAGYQVVKAQFHFVYKVAARLSRSGILRFLKGSYANYTQVDASVHIRKISHQPIEFCHYVLLGMMQMGTEMIITSCAIIAILLFNAKLFLLLLVILAPPVMLTSFLLRKKLRAARTDVKSTSEKTTQYLQEALDGYIESNVYQREPFFSDRYTKFQQKLNMHLGELQVSQAMPSRVMEIFAVTGLVALIIINRYTNASGTLVINIGAFIAAAYKIIPGITKIANLGAQMRIYAFTLNDMEAGEVAGNGQLSKSSQRIASVEFSNVTFSYAEKQLFSRLNIQMQPGDFIGMSSASGSGKTTMINLLLGFISQNAGEILFNGNSTTAEARQEYWTDIAYVKQQVFLIYDSILTNIALSEKDADEALFGEVIKATGLENFIQSFPEGNKKVISGDGKNISGGQRQRIAFARALYKNAGLLILDEPFSELDETSEQQMLLYLKELAGKEKIILLITHNKKSLQACNKIISFDE